MTCEQLAKIILERSKIPGWHEEMVRWYLELISDQSGQWRDLKMHIEKLKQPGSGKGPPSQDHSSQDRAGQASQTPFVNSSTTTQVRN